MNRQMIINLIKNIIDDDMQVERVTSQMNDKQLLAMYEQLKGNEHG